MSAVKSHGKLCEEHGYTYEWTSSQKSPDQTREEDPMQDGECRVSCCPRIVVKFWCPQDSSRKSSSPATERSDDPAPGNWRDSPKTQNNNKWITIEPRKTDSETCRKRYRNSQKIMKIQKCLHPHTLLMTRIRNVLQKWHPGSNVYLITSRKIEIAKSACQPRWQELLAEGALAKQYLEQKSLMTWIQQIAKSSVEKVNLEAITDT